jgi:hypothetical protein
MEHATILRTESVGIETVQPHPMNARRGDVSKIEQSLRQHGQYVPIVVHDATGHILKGNHTHRVMREKLGRSHILATFVSCTEEQALAILAVDNKTTDGAGYNDESLLALLEQLNGADMLGAAGYLESEMDDLVALLEENWDDHDPGTIPDDVPKFEPKENPRGIDGRKENEGASYAEAVVRTMMLTYPVKEYVEIIDMLTEIGQRLELEDNASIVERLIRMEHEGLNG